MRRTLVLALFVAVLLAGCSGLPTDLGRSSNPTDGAATDATRSDGTASSTTTLSPSPTPSKYPPGVSESGLDTSTQLLSAHADAVNETGYHSRLVITSQTVNESANLSLENTIVRDVRVPKAGYPYRLYVNNSGGLSTDYHEIVWANESTRLSKRVTHKPNQDDTAHYTMKEGRSVGRDPAASFLVEFARHANYDVTSKGDRVVLEATGIPDDAIDSWQNVTVEGIIEIDRSGRIQSADLRFEFTTSDVESRIASRLEYSLTTGGVDVKRPKWADTAVRESTAVTIDAELNGDYVAVTNTGREPIPKGYGIELLQVKENGASGSFTELSDPIEPGETVYVYYDGANAAVSDQPPENPRDLSGTYRVQVTDEEWETIAKATVTTDD